MADGVDIDLYAEELEPDFINQESDYNHDGGVDLYDDVITAPSSDDNQSDEVDFSFSDYEYNSHHDASKSSTSPTGHRELHSRRVALYVGNLTWWTTDQDITDAIHGLGVNDLVEIKFYENRANGQSKGFCVVSLGSEQSSRILMDKLPKKELHGQAPVVTHCNRQALNQFEMQSRKPNPPNSGGRNAPAMGPPRGMPPQGPPRRGGMPGQFSSPIRPPGGPMGHPMSQGHLAPYPPGVGHLSEYGQLPPGMRPNGPPPPGPPGPPMRSSGPPPGPPLPPGMQGPMPPRPGGPGPPPPGMGLVSLRQPPPHGSMPMGPRGPPHPDPRGLLPPRSEWNRPPGFPMPGPYTPQPPPPGPPPSQGPPQSRPPGPGPPQSHLPPLGQGPSPHVNPAFFPSQQGQPPPVGPPPNSQSGDMYNRPPPPQYGDFRPPDGRGLPPYNDYRPPSDGRQEPPMSEAEFEEIMGRNRTVSSSAIARAVADASAGEYASAIETLVTAISLIKQSKVANDERCKIIIGSLQDTLHGIESKSYGSRSGKDRGRSRERERSRERDRSSHREKGRSSRRERSRSRDREYRERSRERDRYHDDRYREKERDRERDREREHRSSRH